MALDHLKIQIPPPLLQMLDIQMEKGQITSIAVNPAWQQFFHVMQMVTFYTTCSGPTTDRPTASSNSDRTRWVGMQYMDTDLGYPVFLKIASTSVWVDANGVVR